MKNILKSIMLGAGLLSFTACSDFLDQTSPSELTGETVFESPYYTSLALNKVYGLLTQDQTYSQYIPIVWGLDSDCELVDGLGNDATNATSERGNMNYNSNPGWANIAKLWDAMYGIIENASLVIEGVDASAKAKGTDAEARQMQRYKGEALTLRAMVYFDLIRFFGDVPMKMESSKSDLSNAYLGKTDRDVILDRLIEDLKVAIDLLPWAGEQSYTTEHVNKGYAHSLLANIALTRAGWAIRESAKNGYETAVDGDKTYPTQRPSADVRKQYYELALNHLSAVIKSGRHNLNPSLSNAELTGQWDLINQRVLDVNYQENVFEIPMALGLTGELGYTVGVRINGASAYYGDKGNSSGKLKVTAPLFWSYDDNDLRRDITCAQVQLAETEGVITESLVGNTPWAIYCGKWDIRKMSEEWRNTAKAAGNAKTMTGINVVRMRYPMVLLMYAECVNELLGADAAGPAGLTARQALAMVHNRAFTEKAIAEAYVEKIPSDKEGFFNAIVDENMWELAGEGLRKFDLIRWNLLGKKITDMKHSYVDNLKLAIEGNGGYPSKVYFNYYSDPATGRKCIDLKSVTWRETPDNPDSYDDNKGWFGSYTEGKANTQVDTYLPSIASGLSPRNGEVYNGFVIFENGQNANVINRYIMPLASTTISASGGKLHNSYGFSD